MRRSKACNGYLPMPAASAKAANIRPLRIVGAVVIAIIVGLRFYVRRRAKAALASKGR